MVIGHLACAQAANVPAVIGGLVARGLSSTQIALTWNDLASTQTNILVARSGTSGGPYTVIATLPAAATSFTDSGDQANTAYYYVVRGVNAQGPSTNSNEAAATTFTTAGTQYYVDAGPNGNDANTGKSISTPFQTIQKAASVANAGDTVNIRAGTYRQTVTPAHSGTATAPITFCAYISNGVPDTVTVSGLDLVTPGSNSIGTWQQYSNNIYKIQLTSAWVPALGQNQVYVNGRQLVEARWPNVTDSFALSRATSAIADGGSVNLNNVDSNGNYACTYSNASLSVFPAGFWNNATMVFSPGEEWIMANATITSFASNTLSFRYNDGSSAYPGNGDPYFLIGKLAGLDTEGECFYDLTGSEGGTPYMLYLWQWGGGSPAANVVEMSKGSSRATAFNLYGLSYIRFQNLNFLGAAASTSSGTSGNTFDTVTFNHSSLSLNYGGQAVYLGGTNERVVNCTFIDNASVGIAIATTCGGAVIENNVIDSCWSSCIDANTAQNCIVRRNTAFNAGGAAVSTILKSSSVLNNHVYTSGTFCTDIAGINSIYGGNLQGTQIGYNWVHDIVAILDYSNGHVWNGGAGIRHDGGGGSPGISDTTIHHNVVWNTTQSQNIIIWALDNTMTNYGNEQVRVYNNTCAQEIGITQTSPSNTYPSAAGMDFRNNIAAGFIIENSPITTGMTNANNLYYPGAVTGNLTGNPDFVSPQNYNFSLSAGSPAVDAGALLPPYTDGFSNSAPDLGALEQGITPFLAGAVVRPVDLAQLTLSYQQTPAGAAQVIVSNLPVGRSLPLASLLEIGTGAVSSNFYQCYNFSNNCTTAIFTVNVTGLTGAQPVSLSLDGVAFTSLAGTIQAPTPLGTTAINAVSASTATGGTFTLTGSGFAVGNDFLTPVYFSNLLVGDLVLNPLPITFNSAALIAAGKMRADGGDLRFLSLDGSTLYNYWIESGLNTSQTLVWIAAPDGATNEVSGENESAIYMSYGNPALVSQSSLGAVFPALTNSALELWLNANTLSLTNGAPVSTWNDTSGAGNSAIQTNSAFRPIWLTNLINGQPVVRFNGTNNYMDIGNGLGTNNQFEFFVVYNDPSPGTVPYQRLFSAIPNNGTYDYVAPAFAYFLPYTGSGVVTPSPGPVMETLTPSAGANASNFRLCAQSKTAAAWFKGDLAEVIACTPAPASGMAAAIEQYLNYKYALVPAGSATPDFTHTINPLTVTVGGVQATNVQVISPTEIIFTLPPSSAVTAPTLAPVVVTAPGAAATLSTPFYFYTTPIDAWRITEFLNYPGGPTGPSAQNSADPNHDGLCNLLDYALGLNPLLGHSGSVQTVSLQTIGLQQYLTITVTRSADPSDITLGAEVSSDLVNWASGPANTTVMQNTPTLFQARDNTPVQSSGKRYIRWGAILSN